MREQVIKLAKSLTDAQKACILREGTPNRQKKALEAILPELANFINGFHIAQRCLVAEQDERIDMEALRACILAMGYKPIEMSDSISHGTTANHKSEGSTFIKFIGYIRTRPSTCHWAKSAEKSEISRFTQQGVNHFFDSDLQEIKAAFGNESITKEHVHTAMDVMAVISQKDNIELNMADIAADMFNNVKGM